MRKNIALYLALILLSGATMFSATSSHAFSATSTSTSLNCRYGVANMFPDQGQIRTLGAGWELDFGVHSPTGTSGAEHVQVIRVNQDRDKNGVYLSTYTTRPSLEESSLGSLIAANPANLWIVGNEPDRGPNPGKILGGQDNTYPDIYAQAYHDTYNFIKQHDPTAQVAVAGLVEITPGRLQYWDKVWQAYQQHYGNSMPVDVWNMHLYILPEATPSGQPNVVANIALGTDPSLAIRESGGDSRKCIDPNVYCLAEHDNLSEFAGQIVAMRQWMKDHGLQNKPLILSEYSILYPFEDYDDPVHPTYCTVQDEYGNCFTSERVIRFMNQTFTYLEYALDLNLGDPADNYHLVQQWLWFSTYYEGAGYVSNLFQSDHATLSEQGQAFQSYVAAQSHQVNLYPGTIPPVVKIADTNTVAVTLSAKVRNNGNVKVSGPIAVTFYSDASLTRPIGMGVINNLDGCARHVATVTTTWSGLTSGSHQFWVKVDSSGAVLESNVIDNVGQGVVLVNPKQVYLPIVVR